MNAMGLTRRELLAAGVCSVSVKVMPAQEVRPAMVVVDHLLLGAPDLEKGIAWVEKLTGVRAAAGGSHPGMGTRNALLSLGGKHYLEIIAPDPAQSSYSFHIDVRRLTEPRLVTWAARTHDIEMLAKNARDAGFEVSGPRPGSRIAPSGKVLRWKSLSIANTFGISPVEPIPFFIEWDKTSTHPAIDSPAGCRLDSFFIEHPSAAAIAAMLKKLRIDAGVRALPEPRIGAAMKTSRGRVDLW